MKKKKRKKPTAGCVRETPFRKVNPTWMCKRNSADKTEASTVCVRETPPRKMNPPWDV